MWRSYRVYFVLIALWGLFGLFYVSHAVGTIQFTAAFKPINIATGNELGRAVALSPDFAFIASPFVDTNGSDSGSVYVYERTDNDLWQFSTLLVGNDTSIGDEFGVSIAIDGDTAVIGALRHNFQAGAAYVFIYSQISNAWVQQAKLTATDSANGDLFGQAVAIEGDTIVVGALNHDPDGVSNAGAAYVFTRNGTTWTQHAKLIASDPVSGDSFGGSVGITGNTIMVGAAFRRSLEGAVYVFDRSGETWTQSQLLTASDAAGFKSFAGSLDVRGDLAIVGSVSDNQAGTVAGAAYVFERSGGIWTQSQKLIGSDVAGLDWFGWDVALDGVTVVVSALRDDDVALDTGALYVFEKHQGMWVEVAKVVNPNALVNDRFGRALALVGNATAVGMSQADFGDNQDVGIAYLLEGFLAPNAPTSLTPIGIQTTDTPNFSFDAYPYATDYQLYIEGVTGATTVGEVWQGVFGADSICNDSTCTIVAPVDLNPGWHRYWLRGYNAEAIGLWSVPADMEIVIAPELPRALAPMGWVSDPINLIEVSRADNALWFGVWLSSESAVIGEWWRTDAACEADACVLTLDAPLPLGSYAYWTRSYNPYGFSAWSEASYFGVSRLPEMALQIAPVGSAPKTAPNFVWQGDEAAQWWQVWLSGIGGKWLASAEVCTGTDCEWQSDWELEGQTYTWWVQGWSPLGYGAWSAGQSFSVGEALTIMPVSDDATVMPILSVVPLDPIHIEQP